VSTDAGATFVNYTTSNGLGDILCHDVWSSGGTLYVATHGGLSISTDGGATFSNYSTANGLADNVVWSVYADGGTVYAGTNNGLSIGVSAVPAPGAIALLGLAGFAGSRRRRPA
jgi:MYXO-CTERM domain-containing protein